MRWTLPNIITLARICLTPVVALLPFIQGYWPKVIAFIVFLIAAFSDLLDGYLARRYGTTSELGILLDPIADKLLLFATLIPIFWMTRHPTILAADKVDYAIPWWGSFPLRCFRPRTGLGTKTYTTAPCRGIDTSRFERTTSTASNAISSSTPIPRPTRTR